MERDLEAERVVVVEHPAAAVGEDPALGRAAAEGADDLLDVEAGLDARGRCPRRRRGRSPARITWLTALTAWPAPIGPTWVIVVPSAARTGRARSTSAASPPTKIVRVAFCAPSLPPETGRVDHRQPALGEPRGEVPAARRRDRRAVDDERAGRGARRRRRPGRTGPPRRPACPRRRSRRCRPRRPRRPAGWPRARRRARRARRRGPGVRFQPVTAKPARARLAAIAAPIVPRPRNATRCRFGRHGGIVVDGHAARRSPYKTRTRDWRSRSRQHELGGLTGDTASLLRAPGARARSHTVVSGGAPGGTRTHDL